ncbi:DUF1740-domain-containing protein [Westerdykella ornata]|uniref:DUF1740-domain-containing protein n=1 Tax=Westerdykella ornata TaxID=318751 RepID=A0A6A6JER8_WESOR|nr:DUF1740-domain-containing protein [Westerdykella ornata]KAF2274765.1 DUF1740-domain-containing protein [Westerdykella ornata]
MASNVPKFTSFRPKPKEQLPKAHGTEDRIPRSSQRHERNDKHDRREKPLLASSRNKSPGHVPTESSRAPSKQQSTTPYFVDARGDRANLTYGSLNRYDTPPYRRYGYGSILGLPPDHRIDRDRSSTNRIVVTGPTSMPRDRVLTSPYAARKVNGPVRLVRVDPTSRVDEDAEFIEIPRGKKRKRGSDHDMQASDRRSWELQGGGNSSDSASDSDASQEVQPDPIMSAITQRNSMLIQRTRNQPNDLQAWLDLVDHQETMMKLGRESSDLSTTDRRSLAEVRISTYEEAIQRIGNVTEDLVVLHLGLMSEASKAWDASRLEKKWAEILNRFPANPDIWIRYLDFQQTHFGGFKHDNCRDTFHQCLKALRHSSADVAPEVYLHVLVRLTDMIRSSGYQELARAIWQALLEFHLLSPDVAKSGDRSSAVSSFEEFWESEIPRIGEENATGWRNPSSGDVWPSSPVPLPLKPEDRSIPVFEDFRLREVERIEKLNYPGRMADDIGDDPFHVILFSDIAEYLHILPPKTSEFLIIDAFLCFSHMPPLHGLLDGGQRRWWLDPIMKRESVCLQSAAPQNSSFVDGFRVFSDCPGSYKMTLDLLFDRGFSKTGQAEYPDESKPAAHITFVRRALTLLAKEQACIETIGEYLLAFERAHFPNEVSKTAKQLIKSMPTSLRLYNAYALVEARQGDSRRAEQVCRAALSMHKDATLLDVRGLLPLFHTWVWEALRCNNQLEALWRLVSPPDRGQTTARPDAAALRRPDQPCLLRGHRLLNEANDRALLGRDFPSAILATSLLAFLVYLSKDGDIGASLAVHENLSEWFLDHDLSKHDAAELHAQFIASLLVYHATHAPIIRPALLRETLRPFLGDFPNNTVLLSVYAANEARFAIDDRVRAIMHHSILGDPDSTLLTTWLFAIFHEMRRGETAGSTSHSVRALFRKAEATEAGHSPALWYSYILFEVREYNAESRKRPFQGPRRDRKRSKHETLLEESHRRVRETFFLGLTHLPWCKEYMMLAFTLLKDFLDDEEKKKVYNVMIEKELRIYVEVGV